MSNPSKVGIYSKNPQTGIFSVFRYHPGAKLKKTDEGMASRESFTGDTEW